MWAVAFAGLAFATASPLAIGAGALSPTFVAMGRTLLAGLVLAAVSARTLRRSLAALGHGGRARLALGGVVLAGHFVCFLAGLARTSLAAAVALVSLEPLAVVLGAFVVFRVAPTRQEGLGLGVATAGALVVASAAGEGPHTAQGDLLVVAAVVLYAGYVLSARSLAARVPALPYAAFVYLAAAAVLAPFALAGGVPDAPAAAWKSLLALALVPTLLGHTLVQTVARTAPPVLVALVPAGEMVGSIALGALWLGVTPTPREAFGAGVVLAGALLVATARRRILA